MAIDLQNELTELRRMILAQGAIVERRLSIAARAVRERDFEGARSVRHGDRVVDDAEVEIEEVCMRILALSQPVASDLRFVLAVLRVNADLERIGDLAKSVAKRMLALEEAAYVDLPPSVRSMAEQAETMVGDTLGALADEDCNRARRVRRADDRLDDLQREVFTWAHHLIPEQVEATETVINILSIARSLERVGDLATNIAEDVIFLVEGMIVRHGNG